MEDYLVDLRSEYPGLPILYYHTGTTKFDYSGIIVVKNEANYVWEVTNTNESWEMEFRRKDFCRIVSIDQESFLVALRNVVKLSNSEIEDTGPACRMLHFDDIMNSVNGLREELGDIKKQIKELEDAILYAPGGTVYEEAKKRFENYS